MLSYVKTKTIKRPVTKEQVAYAKILIAKGLSKRAAAKAAGMSDSVLHKKLKFENVIKYSGRKPTFTPEQEAELVYYCKEMYDTNSILSMNDIRHLAFQYAEAKKIKTRFDESSKLAGPDWARSFVRRHPELKPLRRAAMSLDRDDDSY